MSTEEDTFLALKRTPFSTLHETYRIFHLVAVSETRQILADHHWKISEYGKELNKLYPDNVWSSDACNGRFDD